MAKSRAPFKGSFNIIRLIETCRYLQPRQITARGALVAKRLFRRAAAILPFHVDPLAGQGGSRLMENLASLEPFPFDIDVGIGVYDIAGTDAGDVSGVNTGAVGDLGECSGINANANISFFKGDFGKLVNRNFYNESVISGLADNRFKFLNKTHSFGEKIDWNHSGLPKLWLYYLHYFNYVVPLGLRYRLKGDSSAYTTFRKLVLSWIQSNPYGRGNGWEPYTISLRAVNWIKGIVLFKDKVADDGEFLDKVARSLSMQADFLSRNLEYHLLCNHLLSNAIALIWLGVCFGDADGSGDRPGDNLPRRWLEVGLNIFEGQLKEQILEDGGHFERSPMYHLILLRSIVETVFLLKKAGFEVESWIVEKVERMFEFVYSIVHPDGEIPLFNDSALGKALSPAEIMPVGAVLFRRADFIERFPRFSLYARALLGGSGQAIFEKLRASRPDSSQKTQTPDFLDSKCLSAFKGLLASENTVDLSHTGFYVIRGSAGAGSLIIDCGRLGPSYNPSHGHAAVLTYELSIGDERWVVDPGVYTYEVGNERSWFRGTASHNTLVFGGMDQSDLWGSFRVGRRARGSVHDFVEHEEYILFRGSHNGYVKPFGIGHERTVLCVKGAYWLILDRLNRHFHFYGSGKQNRHVRHDEKSMDDKHIENGKDDKYAKKSMDGGFVKRGWLYSSGINFSPEVSIETFDSPAVYLQRDSGRALSEKRLMFAPFSWEPDTNGEHAKLFVTRSVVSPEFGVKKDALRVELVGTFAGGDSGVGGSGRHGSKSGCSAALGYLLCPYTGRKPSFSVKYKDKGNLAVRVVIPEQGIDDNIYLSLGDSFTISLGNLPILPNLIGY